MTLSEHLRELRNRLFVSVCAVLLAMILAWIFYNRLFGLLLDPYDSVVKHLAAKQGIHAEAVINDVSGPFMLRAKISLMAGIVLASPVWLYELWAFIMPGLHRNERRWTMLFVAIASPLFLGGVWLGYEVLPKGLTVLLSFTPERVTNLVDVDGYFSFVLRVLLVFGVAFEIPLFVVLLNLAGVVKARHLARWRSWIIFLTFVFAAVATPSTDPITMLLLALPMTALFLISEVIARAVDAHRARAAEVDYSGFEDDEASPI
ncbi:MAG TPA: twin-arginine translocase subunit TatC [Nocardioidaceae bacterium]|nr:twin-arginine translocase subunit TatC [Nocardioidaceae bacterium]